MIMDRSWWTDIPCQCKTIGLFSSLSLIKSNSMRIKFLDGWMDGWRGLSWMTHVWGLRANKYKILNEQNSSIIKAPRWFISYVKRCRDHYVVVGPMAPSYTRLSARDHYTSSTLIGGKGRAGPSSLLHTTVERPTEYVNTRWWMWSLHGFLHDIE